MPWRQQRTRPKRGSYCRRVCRQTCASDGVCRDGGHGAHSGNRPQCAYGEDCADCGKRALCTPAGTGMELPIDALRRGTRTPLLLSQLLFVVMGSHRLRARSALAQASWCTQQRAQCLFVLDEPGRRRQGEHDEATEADAGGAAKEQGWPAGRLCGTEMAALRLAGGCER